MGNHEGGDVKKLPRLRQTPVLKRRQAINFFLSGSFSR
jgi:hypothetical protein